MTNQNSKIDKKEEKDVEDSKKENKEVEELKNSILQFENSYKRALADYQNLEKRVREEKASWIISANKQLLLKLLPIFDTLMLASKHSQEESLQISINQFLDVLKSEGIVRIETKDKDFDPGLMECLETVAGEKNKIIEETRAGFLLGDSILRPAQVRVGKGEQN